VKLDLLINLRFEKQKTMNPDLDPKLEFTDFDFMEQSNDDDLISNLNDDVVKEALNKGVDLREYARNIKKDLITVEEESIHDYLKECENIAQLHSQITGCNVILEKMEGMLYGFQHALSSISAEIQCLQEHSVAMNMKLKNRQLVKSELSQLVDEMVVPETMILHILDTPVTERAFLEQLHELNHKINFVKQHAYHDTAACKDVQEVVEKLKFKAISKIREHLIQKIYSFRKPMSNYHLSQDSMLKTRFFYEFLLSTERRVAKEVRDEYLATISKVYFSYFRSYASRLARLQVETVATRDDLMATEDGVRRGFFSSSRQHLRNRAPVFTLDRRDHVINEALEASVVIVPHAAHKSDKKYSMEEIFRSQQLALTDTCSREFHFLSDFFLFTPATARDFFQSIFSKTLAHYLKEVEQWLVDCYDALGIFVCIHLVRKFKKLMTSRGVDTLDQYWSSLEAILWPRFDQIVKYHIRSIIDCNVHNLTSIDNRPHYITRRYAEFSSAIARINDIDPSSRIEHSLTELQTEVQNFILRLAACFNDRKHQLVFLINNYDMLLSVIMERSEDAEEASSFQQLLNRRTLEFVEEVLAPHFGGMMTFVRDCESVIEAGSVDRLRRFEQKVTPLVQGFAAGWRTSVDLISREVTTSFPNFKVGSTVVQATFTQLIQYYHRFQKLFTQAPFKSIPAKSELVNMHLVMVEMKKYKPSF